MILRYSCHVLFLLFPLAGCSHDIQQSPIADPAPKVTPKEQAEVVAQVGRTLTCKAISSSPSGKERPAMATSQPVLWAKKTRSTTFQTASLALG